MEKITTLAEYQQLASRTCPDLGTPQLNLLHMNMGIITEIAEAIDPIKKHIAYAKPLDLVNVGEEIADAMWYITNKARLFLPKEVNAQLWGKQESFNSISEDFDTQEEMKIKGFPDVVALLHGVIPNDHIDLVENNMLAFVGIPDVVLLFKIAEYFKLDFWQILTNNINKLKVRYPEKFTNEAAINRDLDAERTELEK